MTVHDDALSERECWELLATASVGRLALSVRALPVILPVQYYLDDRRLAVCLGHHGLPERALDETIIAFAADSIDPVTRSGWSVQVQGRSVVPRGRRIDTDCGWPAAAAQVVEIEPGRISGHRMHLCPFIDMLLASSPRLPTM
jgi:nitroimidazol reductase NimA-like FMN-containing flavoprotein (pyridoxamine 5'-phosphate oxidase superfamily)